MKLGRQVEARARGTERERERARYRERQTERERTKMAVQSLKPCRDACKGVSSGVVVEARIVRWVKTWLCIPNGSGFMKAGRYRITMASYSARPDKPKLQVSIVSILGCRRGICDR